LARTAVSKEKSRPSVAAVAVIVSIIRCALSTSVPYFSASRVAYSRSPAGCPASADAAVGSSSNAFHATST
jgi:hypothetical protein